MSNMKRTIPIFLENFDWLEALEEWLKQAPKEYRPQWDLRSCMISNSYVACCLTWIDKNGGLCSIQKVAASFQEAVWLALEEFRKTQV